MRDLIAGCAAGKVGGQVVLDLNKDEDNFGEADLPIAIIPKTKEIVLLQMDGNMSVEELDKGMDLAYNASMKVYELQKEALRNKYLKVLEEGE
jgi:exosome complex component RRP41